MSTTKNPYIPINCSFYDLLEESATLKKTATIEFYLESDQRASVKGIITNLAIEDKVEYLYLNSGQKIRLDRIIMFNNVSLNGFCNR